MDYCTKVSLQRQSLALWRTRLCERSLRKTQSATPWMAFALLSKICAGDVLFLALQKHWITLVKEVHVTAFQLSGKKKRWHFNINLDLLQTANS